MESYGFEWVQIKEFKTKEIIYVNLISGDCKYQRPKTGRIKLLSENQWWELVDSKTNRFYYYNSETSKTVWNKPTDGDIVSLAKVQYQRLSQNSISHNDNFLPAISDSSLPSQEKVRDWLSGTDKKSILSSEEANCYKSELEHVKIESKDNFPAVPHHYQTGSRSKQLPIVDNLNYLSLNQSKRNFPRTNPSFKNNLNNNNPFQSPKEYNCRNETHSRVLPNKNENIIAEEDESPPPAPPPRSVSTLMKRQTNNDFRLNPSNLIKNGINRPISLVQNNNCDVLEFSKAQKFSEVNSMSQSTVIDFKDIEPENNSTLSTTTETNNSDQKTPNMISAVNYNSENSEVKQSDTEDENGEEIMFEHHPNLAYKLLIASDDESRPKSENFNISMKINEKKDEDLKLKMSEQSKEEELNEMNSVYEWPKNLIKIDDGQNLTAVMSFSKSMNIKRILVTTDKNVKKHLNEIFKMIQSFMGDRKTRFSRPDLASVIIQRALNNPLIRDELYAQICKQITLNPSLESLTRGWELMCVCLYYFPPSNNFRDSLNNFLQFRLTKSIKFLERKTNILTTKNGSKTVNSLALASALAQGNDPSKLIKPVSVKPISIPSPNFHINETESENNCIPKNQKNAHQLNKPSKYLDGPWLQNISVHHFIKSAVKCFNRSIKLSPNSSSLMKSQNFVMGETPRILSIAEICHVKDFILKPWLFGNSLEDLMLVQHHRFPNLRIPWIQIFLIEEILSHNGHKSEGIFRLSSDLDELSRLRVSLERLFEPFQIVQLWSPVFIKNKVEKYESSNQIKEINPPPKYHIIRPPPENWSKSLKQYSPERVEICDYPNVEIGLKTIDLILSFPLTALNEEEKFLKKNILLPNLLDSSPVQYMLLTPRKDWPFSVFTSTKESDPNIPACLLKMWLRELSEPIIPEVFEKDCLAICDFDAKKYNSDEEMNDCLSRECASVIRKLPKLNRRCLLYLIKFLQYLSQSENAELTLMDSRNLATVIGPNLFKAKNESEPREILESVRLQSNFVQILIERLIIDSETIRLNWEERSSPPNHLNFIKNDFLTPPLVRLGSDGSTILC